MTTILVLIIFLTLLNLLLSRFNLPRMDTHLSLGLFWIMASCDLISTRRFMKFGHPEGNPIWKLIFGKFGLTAGTFVYIAIQIFFGLFVWSSINASGQYVLLLIWASIVILNFTIKPEKKGE